MGQMLLYPLLLGQPLNALINDQIRKLLAIGLWMSTLNVFRQAWSYDNEEIDCDVSELDKKEKLVNGYYNLLFAHPEAPHIKQIWTRTG